MSNLFLTDVSRHQGWIDWDCMAVHRIPTVSGAIIRAGVSWGYVDTHFIRNWKESLRAGIPRAAYHVLYPGQGAERQFDNLRRAMDGLDYGEMPIELDCEVDLGQDQRTITNEILRFGELVLAETGRVMTIYSRANWIDTYTLTGSWRNQFTWHLAQYLKSGEEHPGPVALPAGVNGQNVVLHQTSGSGAPFCVESGALDYNRWQLDDDAFHAYCGWTYEDDDDDDDDEADAAVTLEERMVAAVEQIAETLKSGNQ